MMPGKFWFISKHIQNFVLKPQFRDFFRKPIFEILDLTVVSLKESRFLLDLTCKTYFQPHNLKTHATTVLTMYDTMGQLETKCQSNCSWTLPFQFHCTGIWPFFTTFWHKRSILATFCPYMVYYDLYHLKALANTQILVYNIRV